MSYSVRIKRSAAKDLSDIPQPMRTRLVHAIDSLAEQPLAGAALKGTLTGLRRLRVGEYRIVYEVMSDEVAVLVIRVAHRSESYRGA